MARLLWLLVLAGCGEQVKGSLLPGLGDDCTESACSSDLVCGHEGTCVAAGDPGSTPLDGDCSASVECAWELECSGENVCVEAGSPGTASAGEACAADEDCEAGHYCGDDGTCVDIGIPYWAGASCPADDLEGDFRVLFDVPDLPESGEVDFFALPFPNDTRLDASFRPDLSGFPSPGDGTAVPGVLAALEGGASGWGTNPTVYFRFSRAQDIGSVTADTIHYVSLDETADDYGERPEFTFFTRKSRGKYICQNWLAVGTYDGRPLEEGHTYAVWLTKAIEDESGTTVVRDDGFRVMLQEDQPADVTLGRAWDAYQPLREYFAREGVDTTEIAAAAVFTTGYPTRGTRYFRDVAESDAVAPTASDLVRCEPGATSPCDDGGLRVCGSTDGAYVEVHGRLSLPEFRTADGSLAYDDATLRPIVQSTGEACFALTVPEGTMPEAGWPVAVVAPDVGASFRYAVDQGLAAALAAQGIASFTLELPGHGERGAAYVDTAVPEVWLGNRLQATGDLHVALRFLEEWRAEGAESPTGTALAFDPDARWIVGNGEGAAIGADVLAWSMGARGGVLGNPPGLYTWRFADEAGPVDIEHGLMVAFADSATSRWHPMVTLLAQRFELAEPVNNGERVVRDSSTGAKHLAVVHGVADADTPAAALRAMLRALDIPTAGPVLDDYGQSTTTLPAHENVSTDDGRRTAASVQVDAGHDALLLSEQLSRAAAFLASGGDGVSPTLE